MTAQAPDRTAPELCLGQAEVVAQHTSSDRNQTLKWVGRAVQGVKVGGAGTTKDTTGTKETHSNPALSFVLLVPLVVNPPPKLDR